MTVKIQHDLLFVSALAKPEPVLRLRDVVKELLTQGQAREDVLAELEHFAML